MVEGARLEVVCGQKLPGVRIPPSPNGDRSQATCAAQPRQDRKIAAVSGFHVRLGQFVAFFI